MFSAALKLFSKVPARRALILMGLGAALLPTLGLAQTQDLQTWQEAIKSTVVHTGPSATGCFQANYPSTEWQQVPCEASSAQTTIIPSPHPALGLVSSVQSQTDRIQTKEAGNGLDYTAIAQGGPISSAEGSFSNVAGVTDVIDSLFGYNNYYSLQLNSNTFPLSDSKFCGANINCSGWVQFLIKNNQFLSTTTFYIEYWLINVPSGWCPDNTWTVYNKGYDGCYKNIPYAQTVLYNGLPISNLSNLKLTGQTANGIDTIIMTNGGDAHSYKASSPFGDQFSKNWTAAEFNIFGYSDSSNLNFNNGANLTVNLDIINGTQNAPACYSDGFTAETTNLNINSPWDRVQNSAHSPMVQEAAA